MIARFMSFYKPGVTRRHTTQLEDGTAGIAYQMGLLGLAPPEQFNGGAFQQYYDQGYNARGNQEE